jgi:uncharacterized protein with PIN domain
VRYAETSAVLAWLLDEPAARAVAELLREDQVVTSSLTLIECGRVFLRASARGLLAPDDAARRRARLDIDQAEWAIEPISPAVVERAQASFADDTIRSLDAIHLATAVVLASSVGTLDVLSLDDRVRTHASTLGFRVLPD